MRTYEEMMHLILDVAKQHTHIRAVEMNGSRTNPSAEKDIFQDYDIVYYVTNVEFFSQNHRWVDVFGKRIMMQMPELCRNPMNDGHFTYLMLLSDGNRLDLSLYPVKKYSLENHDSLAVLLYAKDELFAPLPAPNCSSYHINPPSKLEFDSSCNDFWWCAQNVAKGICRTQLAYAMGMLNEVLRTELHFILNAYIGTQHSFAVTTGAFGKYYQKYLSKKQYALYCKTYPSSNFKNIWEALFAMCALMRETAEIVAAHCNFTYPRHDDEQMTTYLQDMHKTQHF